jgi:hypothetical protein
MANSYNGWSASPNPRDFGGLDNRPVPGTNVKLAPGVRAGDVAVVLFYVAEQLNRRVEQAVAPGCWGYNYRANVNNPSQLSCHASGTCFDWNAPKHPNGKRNTFTPAQFAEIDEILREVDNVVVQLRGYDEMHFEIHGNAAKVAAVARRLRGGTSPAQGVTLRKTDRGPEVETLQRLLILHLKDPRFTWNVTDYFGDTTEKAVIEFQRRKGLVADGIVGPKTRAKLGM